MAAFRFRCAARRAWSLIELLVVIAVIAVLISLTLPALRGARESARQTVCTSGLRQFTLTINAYGTDNRDSIPLPNWGVAARFPGWLYGPGVGPSANQPFAEDDRRTGSLFDYLVSPKAYRCPSHQGPFEGTAAMTSFIMNGAVVAYRNPDRSFRLDQFQADAVLMWDANEQGPVAFNDGASYPSEIVPGHHGKGINVGGVDGSAVAFSAETFAQQVAKRPSRLWCNPVSRTGD